VSSLVVTQIDRHGNAAVMLNRPEVHNAFDPEMTADLASTLGRLDADPGVRSVTLSGTGKNFCAGADIEHMKESAKFSSEQNFEAARQTAAMFHALYTLSKPTLACVRGAVRGGGVGLVAACDIAIASNEATFRLSEAKLGIIPAMISPYVIAAIGERHARRYMLSGEEFGAATARVIGLVHEVVEDAELNSSVNRMLSNLFSSGPYAMAAIKRLIPNISRSAINDAMVDETARRIAEIRTTPEGQEGLAAFLEKRRPRWLEPASSEKPGNPESAPTTDPNPTRDR